MEAKDLKVGDVFYIHGNEILVARINEFEDKEFRDFEVINKTTDESGFLRLNNTDTLTQ